MIDYVSGSTGPSTSQTTSASNAAPDPGVPEPSTVFLLFAGLCGLYALRRRAQRGSPVLLVSGARPSSVT